MVTAAPCKSNWMLFPHEMTVWSYLLLFLSPPLSRWRQHVVKDGTSDCGRRHVRVYMLQSSFSTCYVRLFLCFSCFWFRPRRSESPESVTCSNSQRIGPYFMSVGLKQTELLREASDDAPPATHCISPLTERQARTNACRRTTLTKQIMDTSTGSPQQVLVLTPQARFPLQEVNERRCSPTPDPRPSEVRGAVSVFIVFACRMFGFFSSFITWSLCSGIIMTLKTSVERDPVTFSSFHKSAFFFFCTLNICKYEKLLNRRE